MQPAIKPNQVMKNAVDRLLERYSSWYRLKRATAILLRVKALLRKKASVHLSEPITVSEIQQAELAILNYIQMESLDLLEAKSSSLLKLKAFEDENNQLRVGGRLSNAPIPFEAKHPVILPNDHHVTQLIISHYIFAWVMQVQSEYLQTSSTLLDNKGTDCNQPSSQVMSTVSHS